MRDAGWARRGFLSVYLLIGFSLDICAQALPTVDLGYQIYQANSFNLSGGYYNFSNVRYAAPPLGNLRFAKPIPPRGSNSSVDDGSVGRICPGAKPTWLGVGIQFLEAFTNDKPFNFTTVNQTYYSSLATAKPSPVDPRTTEDCLFLDVIVPQHSFDSKSKFKTGSPVLVWIYGGGYVYGDKNSNGSPAGLVKASKMTGIEGEMIVVVINYRLGAFGWLAGPTFAANGTVNAGLYDQRLALEWIQSNIHLFGGDPKRVTVMGDSAGGGSIMFQITAFGGTQGPAPFHQAIIQSPAWQGDIGVAQQETTFQQYLQICNVSTIQEARHLDSQTLIAANAKLVGASPYGDFIVDPVVDGVFVPADPGQLFLEKSFDQTVKVMNGHQMDEGPVFTRPYVTDNASFAALVQSWVPNANASAIFYIADTLYPASFHGKFPYHDQLSRGILFVSEYVITCHTNWLDRAFDNQTYGYQFSVPPGVHAQDTAYTFYNGPGTTDAYMTFNATVAMALQQYITSFVKTGIPSGGANLPAFPVYWNGTVLNLTDSGFLETTDSAANERCLYWQHANYKSNTPATATAQTT